MNDKTRRDEFIERYESGLIPWDDELPPPEVIDFVLTEKPGRALDLGCGFGRSSIYLTKHGWSVDGVDFVPRAVEIARSRAENVGLEQNIQFYNAFVTELEFLNGPYDFALDIGCMHSLSDHDLTLYRDGLLRLLGNGAIYLLFAHLRDESDGIEDERRWIEQDFLLSLFQDGFELEHYQLGTTQVEDKPPWKSGWFRFKRIKNNE